MLVGEAAPVFRVGATANFADPRAPRSPRSQPLNSTPQLTPRASARGRSPKRPPNDLPLPQSRRTTSRTLLCFVGLFLVPEIPTFPFALFVSAPGRTPGATEPIIRQTTITTPETDQPSCQPPRSLSRPPLWIPGAPLRPRDRSAGPRARRPVFLWSDCSPPLPSSNFACDNAENRTSISTRWIIGRSGDDD